MPVIFTDKKAKQNLKTVDRSGGCNFKCYFQFSESLHFNGNLKYNSHASECVIPQSLNTNIFTRIPNLVLPTEPASGRKFQEGAQVAASPTTALELSRCPRATYGLKVKK